MMFLSWAKYLLLATAAIYAAMCGFTYSDPAIILTDSGVTMWEVRYWLAVGSVGLAGICHIWESKVEQE